MSLFGKTCSLCGGRLDEKNICTECGLDNSKNDKNYVSTGTVHQSQKAQPHVHTKYRSMNGKATPNTYKTNFSSMKGKTYKKSPRIGLIIVIIVLVLSLMNILGNV